MRCDSKDDVKRLVKAVLPELIESLCDTKDGITRVVELFEGRPVDVEISEEIREGDRVWFIGYVVHGDDLRESFIAKVIAGELVFYKRTYGGGISVK